MVGGIVVVEERYRWLRLLFQDFDEVLYSCGDCVYGGGVRHREFRWEEDNSVAFDGGSF